MPFTVKDLLVDKVKPVAVKLTDSAKTAISLMMDGNYSQLPVVNEDETVAGIITSDLIVEALNHLRLKVDELQVIHAYRPNPQTYSIDVEVFDLLDGLRDAYAVLVVDKAKKILGIITNYDTATYFRSRAEDMMLVEDIENSLKDCVRTDLVDGDEDVDDSAIEVTVGDKKEESRIRSGYHRAISNALGVLDVKPSNSQKAKITQSVEELIVADTPTKFFADLTLSQYISLFLEKHRWDRYGDLLQLPIESCRDLLDGIRKTRNDLFHFRTELPADRRGELRFCKDLLNRNLQSIIEALRPPNSGTTEPTTLDVIVEDRATASESIKHQVEEALEEEPQLIERDSAESSKYSAIATFLQTLPRHINNVLVTFEEIESIIESDLPRTAYEHRAWWANDPVGHSQSQQWLEVGWRVASVNMSQKKATFMRIRGREQRYITFFSSLITGVKERGLEIKDISPTGKSFMPMDNISSETYGQITFISCSFARGGRFRVELYIDTGSFMVNDFIFDALYGIRKKIEKAISSPLEWEKLDEKRACRIAAYHPGSITDSDSQLVNLHGWAVEKVIEFYGLFQRELRETILEMAHRAEARPFND